MQAFGIKYKKHVSNNMKSNSSTNLNSKVKFGLSFCPLEPMWKGDHGGILSLITITPEKKHTHTTMKAAMATMENDRII